MPNYTKQTRLQPRGGYCARRDFRDQKGRLQEEVEDWVIVFYPTQSPIVSSILLNATGVEQDGLQGKFVGTALKN